MPRPRRFRWVGAVPHVTYFKPRGIPLAQLGEVVLTVDEHEAIRLGDSLGLEQEEAAGKMNISRQTFGRVLASARKKMADAITNGKAIRIEGGDFVIALKRYICYDCGNSLELPYGKKKPPLCPTCKSKNIHRAKRGRGWGRGGGRRGGFGGV